MDEYDRYTKSHRQLCGLIKLMDPKTDYRLLQNLYNTIAMLQDRLVVIEREVAADHPDLQPVIHDRQVERYEDSDPFHRCMPLVFRETI